MADSIRSMTDGKLENNEEGVEYEEILKKIEEMEK